MHKKLALDMTELKVTVLTVSRHNLASYVFTQKIKHACAFRNLITEKI